MRLYAVAAVLIDLSSLLAAQTPTPAQVRLSDVLPAGTRTTQLALSADLRRVYYGDSGRALWFYDRGSKQAIRLAGGAAGDLALSPAGTSLAYTRAAAGFADQHIWALPLDARTGMAAGPERRLSALPGDAPSISPDGKLVAFAHDDSIGVGQSIVIVPVAGGPERVVVPSQRSGISTIRWSPDGQALYYAVNAPVACDPEWSCLELKPEFKRTSGSMQRVSLAGGAPSVLVPNLGNGWPGLSTDGSRLVYVDTGSSGRLVIADTAGKRLQTLAFPSRRTLEGWLNSSTLLLSDRGNVQRLRSYALSDGAARLVIDSLESLIVPSPAPDGRRISAVQCVGNECDIRIASVDGSAQRAIRLDGRFSGGNVWSPDGRWIAYVGQGAAGALRVGAIDVGSGQVTALGTLRAAAATLVWAGDSRSVIVSASSGNAAARRIDFQRMAFDAPPRALRSFVIGSPPNGGQAIDTNTVVLLRGGELSRASLEGDSTTTSISPRYAAHVFGMTVSADTRRVAIRRARDGEPERYDDLKIIEVVRLDGGNRVTIETPFWMLPAPNGLRWLPGGERLVVVGSGDADDPAFAVYLVDIRTKSTRKLFTMSGGPGDLAISPDGRNVFYTSSEFASPRVFTMDLSSRRNGGRQ